MQKTSLTHTMIDDATRLNFLISELSGPPVYVHDIVMPMWDSSAHGTDTYIQAQDTTQNVCMVPTNSAVISIMIDNEHNTFFRVEEGPNAGNVFIMRQSDKARFDLHHIFPPGSILHAFLFFSPGDGHDTLNEPCLGVFDVTCLSHHDLRKLPMAARTVEIHKMFQQSVQEFPHTQNIKWIWVGQLGHDGSYPLPPMPPHVTDPSKSWGACEVLASLASKKWWFDIDCLLHIPDDNVSQKCARIALTDAMVHVPVAMQEDVLD